VNTKDTFFDLNLDSFRYTGREPISLNEWETEIDSLYESDEEYEELLRLTVTEISDLQERMYAHNRYGLLAVFQARDAAGKDGTIQRVFSGVNPAGIRVHSFKQPSSQELERDFMWRCLVRLPERGTIGVFNRSYYEEVLAVKVHPKILHSQYLPDEWMDSEKIWKRRYKDIRNVEKYLYRNGFPTVKFFLHVSKEEQGKRLISRIKNESKNWKFNRQDVEERGYWNQYTNAYEEAIGKTATEKLPWYIIPADDKKNMRLIVAKIMLEELKKLKTSYPQSNPEEQKVLHDMIAVIEQQNKE
jgi:PPK2 family polyphosphate:nucleotide phosphotransferase